MKRLVLVGAGHAHALVLQALARQPLSGVEVLVIAPEPQAPYSGMVPGWLAGAYRFEQIVIDFRALAAAAGARALVGELHGLTAGGRAVELADGSRIDCDVLSLNVGSTLRPPVSRHATVLPLRPLALLRRRYEAVLAGFGAGEAVASRVVGVGGGAAGFEGLLCVLQRLRMLRPEHRPQATLVSRGATLLPGLAGPARRAAQRSLARAGVELRLGQGWDEAFDQPGDLVIWATGAEAHDWQRAPERRAGLAVDDAGFIRIDEQLRSPSHRHVFASGDCASWPGRALPKAGLHAVRMGPVLAHNLRVALGEPGAWRTHRPQSRFLALLATGDGRAIAARGPFGAEGAWAWRWKDRIDRRFVARFAPPGEPEEPTAPARQPRP